MKKQVIWSLFDSETAITKKLNSDKYLVFTIGIASESSQTDDFINIDLSKLSCLSILKKLPRPDIIFASPPCETWVDVSIGNTRFYNRNFNEYNLYWTKDMKGNDFNKRLRSMRLLGQKTAHFTFRIIDKFNPKMWVIENGRSSLIFDWMEKTHGIKGYRNYARYSAYCNIEFTEKPTVFYSNYRFTLRNYKVRNRLGKTIEGTAGYSKRSKVPLQIYKDILFHYEGGGRKNYFKRIIGIYFVNTIIGIKFELMKEKTKKITITILPSEHKKLKEVSKKITGRENVSGMISILLNNHLKSMKDE